MPRKYYPATNDSVPYAIPFQTVLIGIIVILVIYIAHTSFFKHAGAPVKVYNNDTTIVQRGPEGADYGGGNGWFGVRPNYGYTNLPGDVLMNPYVPPLKDDRYIMTSGGTIPINISTNVGAVDTAYRQVGILTPVNGPNKILSLMGRPLYTNRDKWQFYTMAENNIKLPLTKNGRSCTSEYGCDNVYTNETLYVEGYKEPYKVTMYENSVIKYLPFI
jgi:hypothetical protein